MIVKKHSLTKWFSLVVIFIASCSDKEDPAPKPVNETLIETTSLGSRSLASLKVFVQLSGRDIDVDLLAYDVEVLKITYRTTYKGNEINASGLVLLPKSSNEFPIVSFHRGTTVEQAETPSAQPLNSEDVVAYSALTSMGFITVVPDLIGFAESQDIFHPYYIEEPTADAVISMLLAAKELTNERNANFDGRVFLAGYSQGGYVTMAAHKALESDPVEGFEVVASFPGAGGYDINHLFEYLRPASNYPDPYYLAYIGMSYQSYYERNGLIGEFFNEPYASKIPGLFDGINSGSDINAELTKSIPGLIREEVLDNDAEYAANGFLEEKFAENSPIDWVPVAPMFMYHGSADEVVPAVNSEVVYDHFLDSGANPDKLELIIFPGETHGSAVIPYLEDVIPKLQAMK